MIAQGSRERLKKSPAIGGRERPSRSKDGVELCVCESDRGHAARKIGARHSRIKWRVLDDHPEPAVDRPEAHLQMIVTDARRHTATLVAAATRRSRAGEDHGCGAAGVGHQRLRLMYGIR
jgi:hypothetical protein